MAPNLHKIFLIVNKKNGRCKLSHTRMIKSIKAIIYKLKEYLNGEGTCPTHVI